MRNFSVKFFTLGFFIGASCVVPVFANEIRELPLDEKSYLKYSQSKFVLEYKLNIQKMFLWTEGLEQGILLTAQSSDPQSLMECSVLSWKNGRMKLVGASQLWHRCAWLKKQPLYFSTGKKVGLRFYNEVDITGYEIDFSPSYIELLFDKKNKEFCMMDYFSSATPKCMVF